MIIISKTNAVGLVTTSGLLFTTGCHKYIIIKITFLVVLSIPLIIQLLYNQSRAAWLAAIVGTIVLIFPVSRKLSKPWVAILIFLLLIAGAFLSIKLYHFKKDSADGRLLIWTISVEMMREKPLTGFGPDGFRRNYLLRQGEYLKNHPNSPRADLADDSTAPFNEFLKIGIEQGIVGLFFVFACIYMAFKDKEGPLILKAILAAIIVFSSFSYPFEFVAFQVLLAFCMAGLASTQKSVVPANRVRNPLKNQVSLKLTCTCLILIVGASMLFFSWNYYSDVEKWNHAIQSFSSKDNRKTVELQSLYPALKNSAWFVFTYVTTMYYAGHYNEAIPLLEKALELSPNT